MTTLGLFDVKVNRQGTYSRKTEGSNGAFRDKDILPLWVADSEFRSPQPIIDALVARAAHGIYGYSDPPPALVQATLRRLTDVYGCAIAPKAEWLRWLPGLWCGLSHAIRATCASIDDIVCVATPIYPPFLSTPSTNNRSLIRVALAEERRSSEIRYSIDWEAMEIALAKPSVKVLLWCNPQNPAGRCWTHDEMSRLARMCVAHSVVLVSDEVWGEIVLRPSTAPFCSALSLLETVDGLQNSLIVMTSPSKCFNVAGLDIAVAIIPNLSLLKRFHEVGKDCAEVTPFGIEAALAAYSHPQCEVWRQSLAEYVQGNVTLAASCLSKLSGVHFVVPEASFLMLLDLTDALPPKTKAVEHLHQFGVGLSDGVPFGCAGPGWVRLNLGCPRATLQVALDRIALSVGQARGISASL